MFDIISSFVKSFYVCGLGGRIKLQVKTNIQMEKHK